MARPLRIEYPEAWYHVMNRGLSYTKIYRQEEDYKLFLTVIKEACILFNVYISSYCLMNNHYHLLINTPEGNLSRFMRHVNGVYTQRFNRKHKRDGPLFRGRYKAILIQADEYLTQVVKYIHNNPLKAKMVNRLEEYKWSSHSLYLQGKSKSDWIDMSSVLVLFSSKRKLAIKIYKEFMGYPVDKEVNQFYSKKNQSSILGESSFRDWIKNTFILKDDKAQLEIKEKRVLRGEKIIEIITHEVCRMFKIDIHRLFEKKRGKENIPRCLAISLSRELSGLTFLEIADKFHTISYKTIAATHFKFKQKMILNKKLSTQYIKIKRLCSQAKT